MHEAHDCREDAGVEYDHEAHLDAGLQPAVKDQPEGHRDELEVRENIGCGDSRTCVCAYGRGRGLHAIWTIGACTVRGRSDAREI